MSVVACDVNLQPLWWVLAPIPLYITALGFRSRDPRLWIGGSGLIIGTIAAISFAPVPTYGHGCPVTMDYYWATYLIVAALQVGLAILATTMFLRRYRRSEKNQD